MLRAGYYKNVLFSNDKQILVLLLFLEVQDETKFNAEGVHKRIIFYIFEYAQGIQQKQNHYFKNKQKYCIIPRK